MINLGLFKKEFQKLDLDLQIHTIMLIKIATEIAKLSNKRLDQKKLIACTVLHDIKNHKQNHAIASADYAKKYLIKNKFKEEFITQIYQAIYNHTKKPRVKDFTISCFYDADILCRFYALGIIRA